MPVLPLALETMAFLAVRAAVDDLELPAGVPAEVIGELAEARVAGVTDLRDLYLNDADRQRLAAIVTPHLREDQRAA
jgi:hypothetical protein